MNTENENICEECGKEGSCEPYFKEQHGFSVCESCIIENLKNEKIQRISSR